MKNFYAIEETSCSIEETYYLNTLRTSDILLDSGRFHARNGKLNAGHVRDLSAALRHNGRLDALLVWQSSDDRYYLADGWHRLAAYKEAGVTSVPCRVYDCTEDEARMLPIVINRKKSLSLTASQRGDFAWTLVRETRLSKVDIARSCGISTRTVSRMRVVLRSYTSTNETPPTSWWKAQRFGKDELFEQLSEDERVERLHVLRDQFLCRFGPALHAVSKQSPEALLLAVELALGHEFESALDYLGYQRRRDNSDFDEFADF